MTIVTLNVLLLATLSFDLYITWDATLDVIRLHILMKDFFNWNFGMAVLLLLLFIMKLLLFFLLVSPMVIFTRLLLTGSSNVDCRCLRHFLFLLLLLCIFLLNLRLSCLRPVLMLVTTVVVHPVDLMALGPCLQPYQD